MQLNQSLLQKLIEFRKKLHRFPELSGCEKATSKTIEEFIKQAKPNNIIKGIGGFGLAAVYQSENEGPTVLIRADMDALPIEESSNFEYRSVVEGVAHLCGHDGHSTILSGVGFSLQLNPIKKGRVVLLFQPAEETGKGAALVINDSKFSEIKPDYSFALHNLPGFERGSFFIRKETFASASTGMIINLKGLSSHAAHPEDGNNPDKALAQLIMEFNKITDDRNRFKDFALLTVIHAKLGEVAFGTTPGNATIMATLRTYLDSDMATLKGIAEGLVSKICNDFNINYDISYTEEFPATINNEQCVEVVDSSVKSLGLPLEILDLPFRWSEDFGHFTQISKASLFGVGSGINHPQLHNEDYDFPDEIIEPSILVFDKVIRSILG